MPSQLKIYIHRLMRHDWFFDYSDDHGVWSRANKEHAELLGLSHSGEAFGMAYKAVSKYMATDHSKRDFALLDSELNQAKALEK